jgi:hypothetical protein
MGRPVPNKARGNCEGIAMRPGRFAVLLRRFGFRPRNKAWYRSGRRCRKRVYIVATDYLGRSARFKIRRLPLARVDVVIDTPDLGFQNQRFQKIAFHFKK